MTFTYVLLLPLTAQRQSQQIAAGQNVSLLDPGESSVIPIAELSRVVAVVGTNLRIEVVFQDLPGFTNLYPTAAEARAALDNLFTSRVSALLTNVATQDSLTIAP